jgi:hypothetical protein
MKDQSIEIKSEGVNHGLADEATASEHYQVEPAQEWKLLRKLDLIFTPVFMLVYLTCFLDRGNIGNKSNHRFFLFFFY